MYRKYTFYTVSTNTLITYTSTSAYLSGIKPSLVMEGNHLLDSPFAVLSSLVLLVFWKLAKTDLHVCWQPFYRHNLNLFLLCKLNNCKPIHRPEQNDTDYIVYSWTYFRNFQHINSKIYLSWSSVNSQTFDNFCENR